MVVSLTDVPGRHVLVVDDDEHTRTLIRDLCETAGYRVTQAEDGEAALLAIAKQAPDLLLLDLMMPKKDGFVVLKELRANPEYNALPVILLTAMTDIDGKIRGMELGATDYVTKPFKLIELQTRISSALLVREYREKLNAAEDELAMLHAMDPLTGAGTYSQLKASLDGEVARAKRYGRPASLLLLGIDDFAQLRYQLGRVKCDALLVEMANMLRGKMRGADRLFRLDRDEFVMLLPETDLKGARVAGERALEATAGLRPDGRDGPRQVRVRVAGAAYPGPRVQTSEDLLREAHRQFQDLSAREAFLFDVTES